MATQIIFQSTTTQSAAFDICIIVFDYIDGLVNQIKLLINCFVANCLISNEDCSVFLLQSVLFCEHQFSFVRSLRDASNSSTSSSTTSNSASLAKLAICRWTTFTYSKPPKSFTHSAHRLRHTIHGCHSHLIPRGTVIIHSFLDVLSLPEFT